jgi:hypothetical protein
MPSSGRAKYPYLMPAILGLHGAAVKPAKPAHGLDKAGNMARMPWPQWYFEPRLPGGCTISDPSISATIPKRRKPVPME